MKYHRVMPIWQHNCGGHILRTKPDKKKPKFRSKHRKNLYGTISPIMFSRCPVISLQLYLTPGFKHILDNSGMAFKEVSVLFEQKKLKYFTNDKTCTTSGRNLNYEPLFLVSKRLSWKRHEHNANMMALLRLMETYFTRLALSGTV